MAENVIAMLFGYATYAVAANLYFGEWPIPQACVLGGIKVHAGTAGSGAGSTVVDVLLNGVSVYKNATDRPTLAALSTGEFANVLPARRRIAVGDVLAIKVASTSATGHARLGVGISLELAQGSPREAGKR